MPRLKVTDFSCIESADLHLGRLTFIIGPQSSGKSLLSKMAYYFNDIIMKSASEDPTSPELFPTKIEKSFAEWFPESTWGGKKPFKIEYQAGPIRFEVLRHKASKAERVRFHFSDVFLAELSKHYSAIQEAKKYTSEEIQKDPAATLRKVWTLRNAQHKHLQALTNDEFSNWQLFVPAGRAFLTNAGAGFTPNKTALGADLLISNFGYYLSILRDKQNKGLVSYNPEDCGAKHRAELFAGLLGGSVDVQNEDFVVRTNDGRVIPSGILSSGQQELLPLLLTLQVWGGVYGQALYIEEPEAHLWPDSQSRLIEYIVNLANCQPELKRIIITTHSPYVLSKVNNLLRAGALSKTLDENQQSQLTAIVDKNLWLDLKSVKAYAIVGKSLQSIIDDSGLINAEYLDRASAEIVDEFSELLEFETMLEVSGD